MSAAAEPSPAAGPSAPAPASGGSTGRLRALWPVVRGLIAVAAFAIAVVFQTETFEVKVIGAALLLIGLVEIVGTARSPRSGADPLAIVPHGLLVLVGAALLVLPDLTLGAASRIAGALVIARAVLHVVLARPDRLPDDRRAWVLASGGLEGSIGLLLLLSPSIGLVVIGTAFAAMWAAAGVLALLRMAGRLDLPTEPGDEIHGILVLVADRVSRSPFPRAERAEIDASLFFEGPGRGERIRSFAVMLSLATAIATFGLLQASTAVVIGAMLVAPLMTPMMGLAAALVTGRPRRAVSSAVMVIVGAAWVVALGVALSLVAPGSGDVATNPEVQARTAPTLLDLLVALAAGAVGAYAMSDRRVAAALPGVAIAVALVPPLSVVGICLAAGLLPDAAGAAILFATNFVAIVVAGALMFLAVGYGRLDRLGKDISFARTWAATLGAAVILLVIPLAATGAGAVRASTETQAVKRDVNAWLSRGPAGAYEVTRVEVFDDLVKVRIIATIQPPPVSVLRQAVSADLGRPVDVVVDVVPMTRLEAP
jgi:uncharacterized hydrophobic protein (TIGR00271 family)